MQQSASATKCALPKSILYSAIAITTPAAQEDSCKQRSGNAPSIASFVTVCALSTLTSLGLFLMYKDYALHNGIKLESGCEGPELFFGMLSAIPTWLMLRFGYNTN